MRFRYTEEHLEFLQRGYLEMNIRDLTRVFNRRFGLKKVEGQIKSTLQRHKILCGRAYGERFITYRTLFTSEQELFLREKYRVHSLPELVGIFNGHFGTGFTKRQLRTAIHNRGITCGRTGRFENGHRSWNKGTKGLTRRNRTSFRKGNVPSNRKPLGHERICTKDGYILIKIKERNPYTGAKTRYKHKHIWLWEQAHGSVPENHVVIFRDGDKSNCVLENLMCVSRSVLLYLNNSEYKEAPAEVKPSIMALSKLRAVMFERQRAIQDG